MAACLGVDSHTSPAARSADVGQNRGNYANNGEHERCREDQTRSDKVNRVAAGKVPSSVCRILNTDRARENTAYHFSKRQRLLLFN